MLFVETLGHVYHLERPCYIHIYMDTVALGAIPYDTFRTK